MSSGKTSELWTVSWPVNHWHWLTILTLPLSDFRFRFYEFYDNVMWQWCWQEPILVPPLRLHRLTASTIKGALDRWMPISASAKRPWGSVKTVAQHWDCRLYTSHKLVNWNWNGSKLICRCQERNNSDCNCMSLNWICWNQPACAGQLCWMLPSTTY